MPILKINVNERTLEFSYLDSGIPATSSNAVYTTAIIFHGLAFHSGIFSKAISLAPSKGIRLLCVNRRDYAETTLFSAEELKTIADGDKDARLTFMKDRALEYAILVTRLIEECSLPPPISDGTTSTADGIALMGWSFGNMVSLGIVSAVNTYPLSVKKTLQTYVKRVIIHNAPAVALGIPHPQGIQIYYPYNDPNIAMEDRPEAFMHWASGYFEHGDLSIRDVHTLAYGIYPSNSTYAHMSPEERASTIDARPIFRSETLLSQRFQEEFLEQTQSVLTARSSLPLLEVRLLYGDTVTWSIVYSVWKMEEMARAAGVRSLGTAVLKGKNTFMFWDHPEESLDALLSLC